MKELVGVIGSLMPLAGEAVTEQQIKAGLTDANLQLGFNVISFWLTDVGVEGFRNINWAGRKVFLAGAAAKGIKLPEKEKAPAVPAGGKEEVNGIICYCLVNRTTI